MLHELVLVQFDPDADDAPLWSAIEMDYGLHTKSDQDFLH